MEETLREFVIAVQNAYIASPSFSAMQTVEAGDIRLSASVAVRSPFVSVEYQSYADPFSNLQEMLLGGVEYSPEELPNLRATFDGKSTWIHDRGRALAIRHPGWHLPSPFPSLRTLGELRFLGQITSDFLVGEGAPDTLHGRHGREVRLKPRHPSQSQLLRELHFPFRKAHILFDVESRFPLRMTIYPDERSSWAMLLPPDTPLVITYRDILRNPPEARVRYTPSEDTRRFVGREMSPTDAVALCPFDLPLDALTEQGHRVNEGHVAAVWDDAASQGEVAIEFKAAPAPSNSAEPSDARARLVLRVSNYLLHNLGRRKAFLSSQGTQQLIHGHHVRILDRSALVKEGKPIPGLPVISEAFWEKDGSFWFLLGEGLDASELLQIVSPLLA